MLKLMTEKKMLSGHLFYQRLSNRIVDKFKIIDDNNNKLSIKTRENVPKIPFTCHLTKKKK